MLFNCGIVESDWRRVCDTSEWQGTSAKDHTARAVQCRSTAATQNAGQHSLDNRWSFDTICVSKLLHIAANVWVLYSLHCWNVYLWSCGHLCCFCTFSTACTMQSVICICYGILIYLLWIYTMSTKSKLVGQEQLSAWNKVVAICVFAKTSSPMEIIMQQCNRRYLHSGLHYTLPSLWQQFFSGVAI